MLSPMSPDTPFVWLESLFVTPLKGVNVVVLVTLFPPSLLRHNLVTLSAMSVSGLNQQFLRLPSASIPFLMSQVELQVRTGSLRLRQFIGSCPVERLHFGCYKPREPKLENTKASKV